jgi:hypothetical protein
MIEYAVTHLDGFIDCRSIQPGHLSAFPSDPLVYFLVHSGLQRHPVWAKDRLAMVVYAYAKTVRDAGGKLVEVSVRGTLVSNDSSSCIVATSVVWHTSEQIAAQAEASIHRIVKGVLVVDWGRREMKLPVTGALGPIPKLPK